MSPIHCIIADDEPIARDILRTYCAHLPYLTVVGECTNAMEVKLVLQKHHVDILLLDINMPVIDGVSLLKTLRNPPQVIFTTAYKEYAIDAFDLAACDYLLKPFSLERFIIAIDKAMERLQPPALPVAEDENTQVENHFFAKSDGKIFKVNYEDILYTEASGNYTKIVMEKNILMPGMPLSSVEALLPASQFLRVHRSFIINKAKISHIEGNRVYLGKHEIPIGSNYKEVFLKNLGLS